MSQQTTETKTETVQDSVVVRAFVKNSGKLHGVIMPDLKALLSVQKDKREELNYEAYTDDTQRLSEIREKSAELLGSDPKAHADELVALAVEAREISKRLKANKKRIDENTQPLLLAIKKDRKNIKKFNNTLEVQARSQEIQSIINSPY